MEKQAVIEVRLPQLFPTHSTRDVLLTRMWYVKEGDVLQPGENLLEVEAPPGLIIIPAPPEVTVPYRVKRIFKAQGTLVRLGDLLITLEPERGEQ